MSKQGITVNYNELTRFLDNTNDLALLLDADLSIVQANKLARKFFNHKEKNILNISFPDLLNQYSGSSLDSFIKDLKTEPFSIKKELNLNIQNKTVQIVFHVLKFNIEKNATKASFLVNAIEVASFEDRVTENPWNLETILSSASDGEKLTDAPAAFFRSLISGMPGVIFWKDTDLVYKGCNNSYLNLLGFKSIGEVIGLTDFDLEKKFKWKAGSAKKFRFDDQEVMSKRMIKVFEDTLHWSNEKKHMLLVTKAPIFNEFDEVIGIFGIAQDITEHKTRETALQQAKESVEKAQMISSELDAIIRYAPDLIYWKDRHSVHLGCNDRFATFAGLSRDEVIGKTDFDMPWKNQASSFQRDDDEVIETGRPKLNIQDIMLTVDGKTKIVITNKVPLRNKEGEVIGVFGIATEITKLKETEKKLRDALKAAELAVRSKSEFIANMSHDIRTPITGMIGMVQDLLNKAESIGATLINTTPDAHTQKDLFSLLSEVVSTLKSDGDVLMDATDELLQLCNEILEVIRLESGKMVDESESFNIRELLQHNIELLKPVARHQKLNLLVHIADNIPQFLEGQRIYLDRILLNLISNALKFTKEGSVKVSLSLKQDLKSNYENGDSIYLEFTIEDTGIGIPKDQFSVVFEHFSRLTSSYSGIYKGSGLGLYTVKQYVHAMKGTISLVSQVGQGTCFTVKVPFKVSDHADRLAQSIQPIPKLKRSLTSKDNLRTMLLDTPDLDVEKVRVLVVEDNLAAAIAVKLALKQLNCVVNVAENGKQALQKAAKGSYDLIIIDLGLPDISGMDVTRKIRAFSDQEKAKVPIVALTGHLGDEQRRQECYEAGLDEILHKPATRLALETILQRFIFSDVKEIATRSATVEVSQTNTATDTLPIIDWEACLRMYSNDLQFTQKLLLTYEKELKVTQRILKKAYAKKNIKAMREELHRSLGGVCYLRLPQLELALSRLQEMLKIDGPQDQKHVEDAYLDLQKAMKAFWKVCKSYVNGSDLSSPIS